MAKVNPTLQYSLFSWDSLDEFAHLDDLREVIEIMPNDKLVAILKRRCKDGCKDWPVEAMLNAFYAAGAEVSLDRVPAAQSGKQSDLDEGLRLSAVTGPRWLYAGAVEEYVFEFFPASATRAGCGHGVVLQQSRTTDGALSEF